MKIDIHTHTIKCKQGDAETRNIDVDRFDEIIRQTEVGILAITNHNHFDLEQFNEFSMKVEDVCQIWPGCELDVLEEDRKAHLLVIVNPKNVEAFSSKLTELTKNSTPDNFNISIKDIAESFDDLDVIYIAHYFGKDKSLIEKDIKKLSSLIKSEKRILKEATNSISAGIYISHGHNSIYGSDISNWDEYLKVSRNLPDLRLPVQSFEQFCLLLEKDNSTISTLLSQKRSEELTLNPFKNSDDEVTIKVFNDINIIFGSKGTGKSDILDAISEYYNTQGFTNEVYKSSESTLEEKYDIKGRNIEVSVRDFEIEECEAELARLEDSIDVAITNVSSYALYFGEKETNKISQSLKIKNLVKANASRNQKNFEDSLILINEIDDFLKKLESNTLYNTIIDEEINSEFHIVINKIINKVSEEKKKHYSKLTSVKLFNHIIDTFSNEVAKKTGRPQKPASTGFKEYALNRVRIERDLKKITENINKEIEPIKDYVGVLDEKGNLYCRTDIKIQTGRIIDSNYENLRRATKNPQREFSKKLLSLQDYVYTNSLFEKISEFKEVDGFSDINCLSDLLIFSRYFTIEDKPYKPSTGESSMLLLFKELEKNKEIYIIDEPEKSLGNDYISNIIVPLLKEKANNGKKIIIATHDANIAVRTLPYNSIYRKYDMDKYYTYQGNPFSNELICSDDDVDSLNWKEISMNVLEGGVEAFGERNKIYGN